ncbi:MAG: phenylalanine--tRNA ligase subunit alpha [Candidatus Doudnabacteria bacterium]|nr:phenylalanine--tRNA ligase subunit alpha [Candidatus Doudnabacteria bacterium]
MATTDLGALQASAQQALEHVTSLEDLKEWRVTYLGRKSEITAALRELGTLSEDERRTRAPEIQQVKQQLEEAAEQASVRVLQQQEADLATSERIDITLPGLVGERGTLHPVTQMVHEISEVLERMGFSQIEGPHMETDWRNFEGLNFTPGHPARDMQDTFHLDSGRLLRTHCTSVTMGHAIEKVEPPFKVFTVGNTYRRDDDATHTPMFHQFDAQVLAKDINLSQFKGTIQEAMRAILQRDDVEIRFRQSYFPFTEPSVEVDVTCTICLGTEGPCKVCKGTRWLEMGGAGMTHPNVLRNFGVDPNEWQGFAWGFGVERPYMIKHGIPDIRPFWENDLRWLTQF